MSDVLTRLSDVLQSRAQADPETSYVASLYAKGLNKILEKVGEESTELIIAAKDGDHQEVIKEMADLWFHTLVLLHQQGLDAQQVLNELDRRFGVSGHTEKAQRHR